METAIWLGIFGLAGTLLGGFVTAISKKWRTPTDDREDKKVAFEAAEKLIQRFQTLLAESDEKHSKEIAQLAQRLEALQAEVEEMRSERAGLVAALKKAVSAIRRLAGVEAEREIDDLGVPDSVYVH